MDLYALDRSPAGLPQAVCPVKGAAKDRRPRVGESFGITLTVTLIG